MADGLVLQEYLDDAVRSGAAGGAASITAAIAAVSHVIRRLVASGALAGNLAAVLQESGPGDAQKELDVRANQLILKALAEQPVAAIASEEMDGLVIMDRSAPFVVAIDPIDGSSNIDTNAPVGTIFSILSAGPAFDKDPTAPFLRSGPPLVAGFIVYGPQTALVLTMGKGTQIFTLDPDSGRFVLTVGNVRIPPQTREYAINGSNFRHWDEATRLYIKDCHSGAKGPRGVDFNTRWIASLVAEAYRILIRGGIYLYPADARVGYAKGRLRMVYEASPIAWLIEQAGGAATDGRRRILDIAPGSLHERAPLIFGSIDEVERVSRYYANPADGAQSPLFGQRSLFRG